MVKVVFSGDYASWEEEVSTWEFAKLRANALNLMVVQK